MLLDARTVPNAELIECDLCVVGAGAAGISLAREFAGASLKLCLLESGGLQFNDETQTLYQGEIRGRTYYGLDITRLRYFGGSTNHWTGWCRPLDAIDFEARAYLPHSGWPITCQDLNPYYARAQAVCQLGPFTYQAIDFAADLPALYSEQDDRITTKVWQRSPPTHFGVTYRDDIANAANINCYLYANVMGFENNDDAQTVTQVRVACLSGTSFWVKARFFVLACGGIENPRLLLLSNSKCPAGLGNDHDQVGRFFMLHPWIEAGRVLAVGSSEELHTPPSTHYGKKLRAGLGVAEALQRTEGLPNHGILLKDPDYRKGSKGYRRRSAKSYRTLKRLLKDPLRMDDTLLDDLKGVLSDLDGVAATLYHRVRETLGLSTRRGALLKVEVRMEHLPNPDSRITLSPDRDMLGLNRVIMDWRLASTEKAAMRRTLKIIGQALGGLGAGRLQIAEWLQAEDNDWPEASMMPDYHHMGTTRMSRMPYDGVVDANCRVHGVSNLYIAGSSVFPTGGFSNPTLTIVALALRLADHLKGLLNTSAAS